MNLIGINTEKTYGYKRIHSKIKLHMVTETYSIMLLFFFFYKSDNFILYLLGNTTSETFFSRKYLIP